MLRLMISSLQFPILQINLTSENSKARILHPNLTLQDVLAETLISRLLFKFFFEVFVCQKMPDNSKNLKDGQIVRITSTMHGIPNHCMYQENLRSTSVSLDFQ